MSGVTGNPSIKSRNNFTEIVDSYSEVIKDFPGFISMKVSGSFNSNLSKKEFGDIDLILLIDSSIYKDKKILKKELVKYLTSLDDSIITPFVSPKYTGKRHYNSGEIVSISYKTHNSKISPCQIDNIIATSLNEYNFKGSFLDMTAAKQGLVLGLTKTVLLEQKTEDVFSALQIELPIELDKNFEYEFNLSSNSLQLRLVELEENSFKQKSMSIVWDSTDWNNIQKLLPNFNLNLEFEDLLIQCRLKIQKSRSANRLQGIFKSMISIKSGEIGKQKGIDKQNALDKVKHLFDNKTIGIFSGRFQPCTKKHIEIIEKMSMENESGIVFIVRGKASSKNKDLNPFNEETQMKMFSKILPKNIEVKVISTGFFIDELNEMNANKFVIYSGTDRADSYSKFSKYINSDKELVYSEVIRVDEVSATRVREAMIDNNKELFKALTDKRLHPMYEELRLFV